MILEGIKMKYRGIELTKSNRDLPGYKGITRKIDVNVDEGSDNAANI